MLDRSFAENFASAWIAAWNRHDLADILSHYVEDFEMSSPVIAQIAGEASGRLHGKTAVGAYWAKALERLPGLHFELIDMLTGADSIILYYKGPRGIGAEVFFFNSAGKIHRAAAHYR